MATARRDKPLPSRKTFWQSTKMRFAAVFAILFLIAFVALAMPQDRDRDRDQDRDRDHDRDRNGLHLSSRDRITRDFGGGSGGRPAPDAICEPGFVAVGFHVQTGEYFNQAWLDCARLRPDGDIGDELRMTERTGSPGGRPVQDASCRGGRVLVGLRGRTGASIDEAVGECGYVREITAMRDDRHDDRRNDRRNDRRDYGRDDRRVEFTQSVTRPRPGGRPSEAHCPPGSVVTGFRSMSGEYMDHLWIVCSELERNY